MCILMDLANLIKIQNKIEDKKPKSKIYKIIQRMNAIVVNKVWLVSKFDLPNDIIQEISSYCFYDKETINTRNRMRDMLEVFKIPLINGRNNNGQWWFWAEYGEKQFQALNCPNCGNYMSTNNYHITPSILCSCIYTNNSIMANNDDEYTTIEDIENEEEEYRNYREGRREIIMY